nr:uncharacterized protein LOC109158743 [Ipomoea trifida]
MLSSTTENQLPTGASAEEADLLRRSKKKTKRGLSERGDVDLEMEEEEGDNQATPMVPATNVQNVQPSRPIQGQAISFKGALTGMKDREGFKVWDNSRFAALQNLDEEAEDEAQEEDYLMNKPDGPTGTSLSGKGKRPQTQITEAQVLNDKSETRNGRNMEKKTMSNTREGSRGAEGSKRQGNQAAETESHTVVRGFENGSRVVRTMVTEEGNMMEEVQTHLEGGAHHQDPPDPNSSDALGDPGDPMSGIEFADGQTASGLGLVLQ